jgi:membrane associated rhomboid family serine protease
MASFWDNLQQRFKQGSIVIRLIYANVALFLLLRLTLVVLGLFRVDGGVLMRFVQLPSNVDEWLSVPWTLFTYLFVHLDFMHILFNILWLYFFGGLFLRWFSSRQLGVLYVLGGVAGGLFFALCYSLFPAFRGMDAYLIGASASILALGMAVAFYRPDEPISLFLFGTIRLKWLAVVMVIMDLLSLNGANAGGSLAHLGGAMTGFVFGLCLRGNPHFAFGLNALLDAVGRLFHPKPKMKVTYRRPSNEKANRSQDQDVDQAYRDRKKAESEELDKILDKIKRSGYDSLSALEKQFLFDSSRK